MKWKLPLPVWTIAAPVLAWLVYCFKPQSIYNFYSFILAASLIAAVIAAVHHAEVVAHRVGEPYGTLVLAIAITIIEVAMIVSPALMMAWRWEHGRLGIGEIVEGAMVLVEEFL